MSNGDQIEEAVKGHKPDNVNQYIGPKIPSFFLQIKENVWFIPMRQQPNNIRKRREKIPSIFDIKYKQNCQKKRLGNASEPTKQETVDSNPKT